MNNNEILNKIMKNISTAIFDLDGTLLDSMLLWNDIDKEYLHKKHIDLPENLNSQIEHLSFRETAQYFKKNFNIQDSIDSIEKEWYNMAFYKYATKNMLKPHVIELLHVLKAKNIKISLATSNYRTTSNAALKINGIIDFFDDITTTEEVNRGKAFPDIYLLAAKKLSSVPEKCVVFEDSLPAIKAAKKANMYVIAVKDSYCPHPWEQLLKYSDAGISDFLQLIENI